MQIPKISIIISTYNSERTLTRTLESIKMQTIPENQREILVVDGGSTDRTLTIAKSYRCKIIHNPLTEPVNAKYLGFGAAKGRYVMGLDHDEVIIHKHSLKQRLEIFKKDRRINALHSSGYITPKGSDPINYYINEFGDPFSFFVYGLTKDFRFFIPTLRKRYQIVYEDDNYLLIQASISKRRAPLMEVLAAGGMLDKQYCMKHFLKIIQNKKLFLPYLLIHLLGINPYIAVTKNDPLYHFSSENLKKYIHKLTWRIKNNIYFGDASGAAGFLLRERFEGRQTDIKKFLFIPYSFSLLFPLFDALWLCITRRNWYYLIHLPLSIFTSMLILYHYLRKFLGFRPILTSYDGTRKILTAWQ